MVNTLKEHPIWHSVTQTLAQINPNQIANEHLQACQDQISGYWDQNDHYYETIRFTQRPIPKLISESLGISSQGVDALHWLQLKYSLTLPVSHGSTLDPTTIVTVGELSLILDDNLEVIDENWLMDLDSPYLLVSQ